MSMRIQQPIADRIWHGKTINITSGVNCPLHDCNARGVMYNVVGDSMGSSGIPFSVLEGILAK